MSKPNNAAGWSIRVETPSLNGDQPLVALYAVAVRNPDDAVASLKAALGEDRAAIVAQLPQATMDELGVAPGKFVALP